MKWLFLISLLYLFTPFNNCLNRISDKQGNVFLNCRAQSLRSILEDIRIQTGINFVYSDSLVNDIKITCNIKGLPVEAAVKKILTGLDISYKKFGENSPNSSSTFVLFKETKPAKSSYKAIIVNQKTTNVDTVTSFVQPHLISNIAPVYPVEASKKNIEGKVKLKFLITSKGEINKILVQESSGSEILDSAAIDYINKLQFTPAKTNGKPRSVWMSMVLKYIVI